MPLWIKKLDKSTRGSVNPEIPVRFRKWLMKEGLIDYWRKEHPLRKDYTFFSNPHNSFSRLDYIFMKHLPSVQMVQTGLGLRTYSDHATVFLSWRQQGHYARRQWTLDNFLLMNEGVRMQVKKEIEVFFCMNKDTPNKALLWDAFKAYIHGVFVNQKAFLNLKKKQGIVC